MTAGAACCVGSRDARKWRSSNNPNGRELRKEEIKVLNYAGDHRRSVRSDIEAWNRRFLIDKSTETSKSDNMDITFRNRPGSFKLKSSDEKKTGVAMLLPLVKRAASVGNKGNQSSALPRPRSLLWRNSSGNDRDTFSRTWKFHRPRSCRLEFTNVGDNVTNIASHYLTMNHLFYYNLFARFLRKLFHQKSQGTGKVYR